MNRIRYKTLVVDDEIEAQKRLTLYLSEFDMLEVVKPSASNGKEALKIIDSESPDIVFLDVEMPEMSGMELLAQCKDPYPYMVFVTAYNEYAVEAFAQNAVDYILKPYTLERVAKSVERAVDTIEKDRLSTFGERCKDLLFTFSNDSLTLPSEEYIERIAVKSIGKTTFVRVNDVIRINAADQYVEVHTGTKTYMVRESMDKLECSLNPNVFFRVHRSHIINLKHIVALENVDKHESLTILDTGERIKISNSRKQALKTRLRV